MWWKTGSFTDDLTEFTPIDCDHELAEQRRVNIEQTNASMRLSGFELNAETCELQRRYIAGEISMKDMIDWGAALGRKLQREEGQQIPIPKKAH